MSLRIGIMYIIIIYLYALFTKTTCQLTNSDISSYTFYVPNTYGTLECKSQHTNNHNHEERISLLESIIKNQQQQLALLTESIKECQSTTSAPVTTSAPSLSNTSEPLEMSVNYVRYGHKECPPDVEMIYSGFVGKSYFDHGGGSNYLCLPSDPEWPINATAGYQSDSLIYGTEYENNSPYSSVMSKNVDDQNVPCAVCDKKGKSEKLMIPGKENCPLGWTKEYYGLLMSQRKTDRPADYVCVDLAMEIISRRSINDNGGLLFPVEAVCGSLPCPPYIDGYELSCVVCTK